MQNLKIGQVVSITTNIERAPFTISSTGFTDQDVFIKQTNDSGDSSKYRNSLFMVLPPGNFEMHDELLKTPSLGKEEMLAYEARLETQRNMFEASIQSQKGTPVTFGSGITLKHIDSESYLSGCFECSQGGIGGFKIILSESLSSQIVFRVESYQSFLKEGDNVLLNSPLYIFNPKTKCYLATENQSVITFSQKSCVWTFEEAQELPLVYLQHTRVNGYLSVLRDGTLQVLSPKQGYNIYEPIWIDQGSKITRFNHILNVKRRIRNFVDISLDAGHLLSDNVEYKVFLTIPDSSLEDCFQLIKLDKATHRDILFITSTKSSLGEFSSNIQPSLTFPRMTFINNLVDRMIDFLTQGSIRGEDDYHAVPKRQYLMRDLGSLDQVLNAIDGMYPFIEKKYLAGKAMEEQLGNRIFARLYKVVQICCNGNQRLKIFMEPRLKNIFVHSLNVQSVRKVIPRITPSMPPVLNLQEFEKQHGDNPLFLNFLSLLSKNTQNYPQIYKRLTERWSVTEWVDLRDKRWRYSQGSEQNDHYFEAWIDLCSNICANRNLRAQKLIQKNFSLKNLMLLIRHPHTADKPILRRFVALLHTCYVDTIDFNPVILDRLCEYDRLERPDACVSKTNKSVASETINFLGQYLENQNFDPADLMKNQNLLEVLNLLDRTIALGFWPSANSLSSLLQKLLVILRTHSPQLIDTMRKQNLLTIKVKYFILQIINTIVNFQLDIRVKALTHRFRSLYDVNKQIDVNEWIAAINQTLEEWHLIGPGDSQIEFCYTLVELSRYPNVALLSSNLAILRRLFSQKAEIFGSFERIYLLRQDNKSKLTINDIRQTRQKLFVLSDPTLKFASLSNQAEYGTQIWSPNQKNKGLITRIWELATWMKTGVTEELDYQKIGQQQIFQFFNQRQVNIRRHQDILKSLEVHQLLVKFLANMDEIPSGELARKLMYVIYYYLTLLVWNSLECKNEIIKYLPIVRRQLSFGVGAIDLLRELFDNNPGLIYNHILFQELVSKVLEAVSSKMDTLEDLSHYYSKLLDMLRCTLYYNEKTVPQNQVFVLAKLQQYRQLLFFRTEDVQLKRLVGQYEVAYRQCFQTKELDITPHLSLVITIFNLLGILIEDDNKINIGKCTQIHPYRQLLRFVVKAKRCWPLKRNVRAYINKLYYGLGSFTGIMQLIKIEQFDAILYDLDHFIQVMLTQPDLLSIRLKNPIRFVYLYTFIYLNLEEILISLHHMFTNSKSLDYIVKHLQRAYDSGNYQTHLKFLRLIQRLQFIKIEFFFDSKLLRFMINRIVAALESSLYAQPKQIEVVYLSKVDHIGNPVTPKRIIQVCKRGSIKQFFYQKDFQDLQDTNIPLSFEIVRQQFHRAETMRRYSLIKKDSNAVQISPALLKIFKGIFNPKSQQHKQLSFDETVKKLNRTMKSMIKQELDIRFTIKKKCKNKCTSYCDECIWLFFQADNHHNQRLHSFVEYVKVLLKQNCQNPDYFVTDLKIFLFKMITMLIQSKKPEQKNYDKDSGPVYWTEHQQTKQSKQLTKIQQFLKECRTHKVICQTIIGCELETELELASQLFKMSIAFLMKGNTSCQDAILEEMQKADNNMVARKLNDLIVYVSRKIIDYFKIGTTEQATDHSFKLITNDTYDYFEAKENRMVRKNVYEPDTDKEIKQKNLILSLFVQVFEFLHLLCQNNNVRAKKLIKDQGNPRNSVNLLETAVVSLRKMLKILSPKIIDMPVQLLGFINQTTQLPCLDNQIFIAKSTLFEDISVMEESYTHLFLQNTEESLFVHDAEFTEKVQSIYESFIDILLNISEGDIDTIYNQFKKVQPMFFIRLTFTYIKQLGATIIDPVSIFQLKSGSNEELELAKLVQKPQNEEIVNKILRVQMLAKKIELHNEELLRDFVKFFSSPYFSVLPPLIQIQVEGQQQFFRAPGTVSAETQAQFILNAPRTTQREKIVYLLHTKYDIFNELEFKKTQSYQDKFLLASQLVAVLLNIIICLRDIIIYPNEAQLLLHKGFGVSLFNGLKYAHFFLGLASIVSCINSDRQYLLEKYKVVKKRPLPKNKLMEVLLLVKLVYQTQKFRKIAFILISSIVAFYRPTLYAIHVFSMFARIQSLSSVFEAIHININSLTVVGVFGVAFFYIFSLASLEIYAPTLYESKNQEMCTDWLSCILDLYISGTINSSTVNFLPSRFAFDLIYFIFFGLLFGNIVSGLMTDTFKELRSHQGLIAFDEDNSCYICGIPRQTLQRNGQILNSSYRTAANKEMPIHEDRHNRFNYLLYIYMLLTKDKTDYTGLEYEVVEKIKMQDITWIPSFQRDQQEKERQQQPDLKTQTDEILKLIDQIENRDHGSLALQHHS